MAVTHFFFGLVAAAFLHTSVAQPWPFIPQTVELDLVFPRNDTYAPLDKLPLLWGLQNAKTAWNMSMMFSWELQQLDVPQQEPIKEKGVFPPYEYTTVRTTFTKWSLAPSDPYFIYYFPDHLANFTEGHWKLSWKFGFYINCYHDTPDMDHHFELQKPKELTFRIAKSGQNVDLLSLGNNTCPDQSSAFHIVDYWRSVHTDDDTCPILSPTLPNANPCALSFNETLIDEINAGAETGCSSATVTKLEPWCKRSGGSQLGLRGAELLLLYFSISILSMFLL